MTKQPRSWWPVEGETRLSKRHDEVVLDGEQVIGPYDQESCRVLMQTPGDGGPSGSRALGEKAKATDGAKTLEVQHPRTHGRMGSRTITQPTTEQERSVSALASRAAVGQPAVPSNSEAYKQRCEVVERRAEVGGGHTVVLMVRTTQPHRSEGPPAGCAFGTGMAAGFALRGHFPAPFGGPARSTAERLGQRPTPVARRNGAGRLLGGEPCAGEPHARFWRGLLETGSCLCVGTAPAAYLTELQRGSRAAHVTAKATSDRPGSRGYVCRVPPG